MKQINLWWSTGPTPGNFGDILSPLILEKLGYKVCRVHSQHSSNKFLAIGSTAKFIQVNDVVWGTGIMRDSDPIQQNARYFAVRGPLTGKKVNCNVYGDPGLLCSKLWPRELTYEKELGIIPHYVDYQKFDTTGFDQINLINRNPINIIDEMIKYKRIVSSSLHGIIVAHSYGIPAGWWQPSDSLCGDGSKFQDYALSVEVDLIPEKDYSKVKFVLPRKEKIEAIQNNLINVLQNY